MEDIRLPAHQHVHPGRFAAHAGHRRSRANAQRSRVLRRVLTHEKNIVLGVTGSIAAYKAAELTSQLAKAGCDVRVVMTADALNSSPRSLSRRFRAIRS